MNKGLIIKPIWLEKIYFQQKTLEMRSSNTHYRGKIYLIASGSGTITGEAVLYDTRKLSPEDALACQHNHQVDDLQVLEKWCWAWHLKDVKNYDTPIPYVHPQGAVIWVKLPDLLIA
jgi:hypothetical protein